MAGDEHQPWDLEWTVGRRERLEPLARTWPVALLLIMSGYPRYPPPTPAAFRRASADTLDWQGQALLARGPGGQPGGPGEGRLFISMSGFRGGARERVRVETAGGLSPHAPRAVPGRDTSWRFDPFRTNTANSEVNIPPAAKVKPWPRRARQGKGSPGKDLRVGVCVCIPCRPQVDQFYFCLSVFFSPLLSKTQSQLLAGRNFVCHCCDLDFIFIRATSRAGLRFGFGRGFGFGDGSRKHTFRGRVRGAGPGDTAG